MMIDVEKIRVRINKGYTKRAERILRCVTADEVVQLTSWAVIIIDDLCRMASFKDLDELAERLEKNIKSWGDMEDEE